MLRLCGYDLFRVKVVFLDFKVLRVSMVHQDLKVQWAEREDRATEVMLDPRVTKDTGYVPISSIPKIENQIIVFLLISG